MRTELIHLSTKDVCEPADLLGRLVAHRVQTLEPIRLVAMRNMRAERLASIAVVGNAGEKTFPSPEEASDRVKAALLSVQGVEDSPEARHLLDVSLYTPFEIYLALLAEEVRFLVMNQFDLGGVPGLNGLVSDHHELLTQMGHFRDAILHPVPGKYEERLKALVGTGTVDQIADYVQLRLDSCIERVRSNLRLRVEKRMADLPDEQRVYCRYRCAERIEGHKLAHSLSVTSLATSRVESDALVQMFGAMKEYGGPKWTPSPHEGRVASRLVAALVDTFPIDLRLLDEDSSPPVAFSQDVFLKTVAPIANAAEGVRPAEVSWKGASAAHVARNRKGYAGLLVKSSVLVNESVALVKKHGPEPDAWPDRDKLLISGLGRVNTAILVPIFQCYLSCRTQNAGLRIQTLEEVANDERRRLAVIRLRNEVFHTDAPRVRPGDVLADLDDPSSLFRFQSALAEFLGEFGAGTQ
ncbi:MAG: hypothetical protein F4X77_10600 [Acidobacteriia bacterium]|nr:hypothetical protein [Terriglobia bacterium]